MCLIVVPPPHQPTPGTDKINSAEQVTRKRWENNKNTLRKHRWLQVESNKQFFKWSFYFLS